MRVLLYFLPFMEVVWTQNTAINVADVPQCARDCLSNSTSVVATTCASLNVACLCNSPEFVSTFYCCLSTQCKTSEQATAITFNQQQCAAVNATAPDFVGCSPLKATSTNGGIKSATTVTPSNGGPYSTISSIVSEAASFSVTRQATATYNGSPVLTGTCTAQLFALVSASSNNAYLFPQVGCAPSRQGCCPLDDNVNAVVTRCPQDYFTTSNGCCPSGYKVYSTAIGAETPCFSPASTILIPASTPAVPGLTIISDHVFSKKYQLASTRSNSLSPGSIAGITIVATALFVITAVVMWWVRHKKKTKTGETEKSGMTFPPEEPVLPPEQDILSPQELASPEFIGFRNPIRNLWPIGTFSSSSSHGADKPVPVAKTIMPQELPGSTYINEHHPAFTGSTPQLSAAVNTPTRSPMTSTTGSPLVTPGAEEFERRTLSPGVVSPIISPSVPSKDR